MRTNNGANSKPVIATFEGMAKLGARFTKGDIAISADASNPQIYFCTPADGVDVPIGIRATSAVLSTYFTPYMIDPILLKNGMHPFYSALEIGEADNFIKNPEINKADYEDKLVTLPVMAAFVDKYISGINSSGSYDVVDNSNYKEVVRDLGSKTQQYVIGTWRLPSDRDDDRLQFLPNDVEVTSSDTGLLKVYVSKVNGRNQVLKEFILYRSYDSTNYVVRYLKVNSGVWKNITATDTSTYTVKVKSLYDRLRRTYDSLRYKYDQINQVYKHQLNIDPTNLNLSGFMEGVAVQIVSGNLLINLTRLRIDILNEFTKDLENPLKVNDVADLICRFNITSSNLIPGNSDPQMICDSVFLDYTTLMSGVNYLRAGNNYYSIKATGTNSDMVLTIPVSVLKPGYAVLTEAEIRKAFNVYVLNVKLGEEI